ncbi:acid-sensing ion channel 5, partial [Brachionus plicatilis]
MNQPKMRQTKIDPLNSKLYKILHECLLLSTSHGFPNIIRSRNLFIKTIWIVFSVLSTGLCAYMVTKNIINYMKSEVITKTRIINHYSAEFPTVTICNMNFFTSDFSVRFSKIFENQTLETSPLSGLFEYNYRNQVKNSEQYEKQKYLYSDSIDKIMVECYYDFYPCNRSQFRLISHPNNGNCYQFNSGKDNQGDLKTIYNFDRTGGLRLILNLSIPEGLKYLNPNLGGLIYIHNHTTYPTLVDPVTVPLKTET